MPFKSLAALALLAVSACAAAAPVAAATLTFDGGQGATYTGPLHQIKLTKDGPTPHAPYSNVEAQGANCVNIGDICAFYRLHNRVNALAGSPDYNFYLTLTGPHGTAYLESYVSERIVNPDNSVEQTDVAGIWFWDASSTTPRFSQRGYAVDYYAPAANFRTVADGSYATFIIRLVEPGCPATETYCAGDPPPEAMSTYAALSADPAEAPAPVPLPAALPLAGAALASLLGLSRRRRRK